MQWICDICGYVHDEDEPPDSCPMCGAPKSKFSEWDGEDEDLLDEDFDEDDDEVGDGYDENSDEKY